MKRIFLTLLFLGMIFSITACSATNTANQSISALANSENSTASIASDSSAVSSSEQGIKVDNGVLSDTITFPASMFEGQSIDAIKTEAAKSGVTDVTKNKDGSVTYKLSKTVHQKMIEDTKKTTINAFNKLKNSKDFPYVKDITFNDDFTVVTLIIDKSAYDNTDKDILAFNVGMQTYFFQLINGVKEESIKTTIKYQDQKTKNTFDTTAYPEPTK